jgi:hypothetical protein
MQHAVMGLQMVIVARHTSAAALLLLSPACTVGSLQEAH